MWWQQAFRWILRFQLAALIHWQLCRTAQTIIIIYTLDNRTRTRTRTIYEQTNGIDFLFFLSLPITDFTFFERRSNYSKYVGDGSLMQTKAKKKVIIVPATHIDALGHLILTTLIIFLVIVTAAVSPKLSIDRSIFNSHKNGIHVCVTAVYVINCKFTPSLSLSRL